ncbi:hypothetical protein AAG570_002293 [Ranatra chinensis]|uniref:Large ribosomal subunit protein mL53 n=1 Tax=Ranatra chinensis TaxID=642074 RepID=A0ABD0Y731_9HEMI
MSITFSGTLSRSGGVTAAIAKQLKSVNLKPVNKVVFKFDPFHEKVEQTRYFMFHVQTSDVIKTNLSCSFKTEVVCDRSDPVINFSLANGDKVVFKSANLTALEMFKLFNEHISILAPKETITSTPSTLSAPLSGPGKGKKSFAKKRS